MKARSPLNLINYNCVSVVVPGFHLAHWAPACEFICWGPPFSTFKDVIVRLINKCCCCSYFKWWGGTGSSSQSHFYSWRIKVLRDYSSVTEVELRQKKPQDLGKCFLLFSFVECQQARNKTRYTLFYVWILFTYMSSNILWQLLLFYNSK